MTNTPFFLIFGSQRTISTSVCAATMFPMTFGSGKVFSKPRRGTVVTEFDEGLWGTLVDFMTVYSKEDISVTFKDGTEIHIG